MEFNGSNGKQRCFYHSKLQGSGGAIPDPDANAGYDNIVIIINIGIAHSNAGSYRYINANPDSNRNPAT